MLQGSNIIYYQNPGKRQEMTKNFIKVNIHFLKKTGPDDFYLDLVFKDILRPKLPQSKAFA